MPNCPIGEKFMPVPLAHGDRYV